MTQSPQIPWASPISQGSFDFFKSLQMTFSEAIILQGNVNSHRPFFFFWYSFPLDPGGQLLYEIQNKTYMASRIISIALFISVLPLEICIGVNTMR